MIRRADTTVSDSLGTPEPGVYITVKDDTGALATLYTDAGALMGNPLVSGIGGAFYYNIADGDAGTFTEEYRLSLSDAPRTIRTVTLDPSSNPANLVTVPTRTALAAIVAPTVGLSRYLTEAGRFGLFVAVLASAWTTQIAADPQKGLFVPSATDASIVWKREYDGPANGLWWGATPGVGDTSAAVIAAKTALEAFALSGYGFSKGVPRLYYPAGYGRYFMGTATFELTHTMIVEGDSSGPFGGAGTLFEFADATTGFRTQRWNTAGASTGGVTQAYPGGDGSTLRNLYIRLGYSATEGESHAIHARAALTVENVTVENCPGDGFYANCSLGSGGATEGSASGSRINGLFGGNVRRLVYLAGADTNACEFRGVQGTGCRQATIVDDGFLGSAFYSPESHAAGLVAGSPAVMVYNNGHLFTPKRFTTGHSTNSPPSTATDDSRWYYVREGTVYAPWNIAQWTSGMSVREGGPFLSGTSNNVTFDTPYAESNQSFSQFGGKTQYRNFNNNSGIRGGAQIDAVAGQLRTNQLAIVDGTSAVLDASAGSFKVKAGNLYVDALGTSWSIQGRSLDGAQPEWQLYSGGAYANYYTPNNSANGHRFQTQTGGDIVVIDDNGVNLSGKPLKVSGTTVIDASRNVAAVGVAATAAITSSGGGIGYTAGAGGTVTQATNKATTVILNKLSGEITLNGAALAADTTVSFTLTDSQIGAGDTLTLNHVSGGTFGSYSLNARCAAGSAIIDVRNVTTGSLSEAIVIRFGVRKGSNT